MDRSRYVDLERRLERLAVERPRAYKARALLLALAGYGYLAAVVTILVVACAFLAGFTAAGQRMPLSWRIGFAFIGIALTIGRALWVRIERPAGIRLTRAEAPRFFDEIEQIRRAVGAPRVHEVLINEAYNAAVAQFPRLGPFGWYRNYLIVGYPLLAALTALETRAVLTHEFAHLSRDHSRFTGWIYRVRRTWFQIAAALHGGQPGSASLFKLFADWYTPYFGAYSLVLARRHEFEADRLAAVVVGPDAMADALVTLRIRGRLMQSDFWDPLNDQAAATPDVPGDIYTRLTESAAKAAGDGRAIAWLEEELRAPTEVGETHPSLADRLSALGGDRVAAAPMATRAAQSRARGTALSEYLGDTADRFAKQFDEQWAQAAAASWRARYEHQSRARIALDEMQQLAADEDEAVDSLWTRAALTRDVHGLAAALPLVERVLARSPDHTGARYALGTSMLQRGDAGGITHIEFAMGRDHEAVLPGCEVVRDFLVRAGRAEEAERYVARAWSQMDAYEAGTAERTRLTGKDRFVPHTLDEAAVTVIRKQLEGRRRLKRALLVDKLVQHIKEEPPHVLFLIPSIPLWAWLWPGKEQQICNELLAGLELPAQTWAFVLDTERAHFRSVAAKVAGAEIYRRPTRRDRESKRAHTRGVPTPARPSQSVA
jgi:Zn-dependent protease with chaperone function